MGIFLFKKVENGVCFFVKKQKMGGVFFLGKSGPFLDALCIVSVFFILHFTYLGCAYAPKAPPCLWPA